MTRTALRKQTKKTYMLKSGSDEYENVTLPFFSKICLFLLNCSFKKGRSVSWPVVKHLTSLHAINPIAILVLTACSQKLKSQTLVLKYSIAYPSYTKGLPRSYIIHSLSSGDKISQVFQQSFY